MKEFKEINIKELKFMCEALANMKVISKFSSARRLNSFATHGRKEFAPFLNKKLPERRFSPLLQFPNFSLVFITC